MANGRRVAFVPPAGAVQEFKVETASFDAASGHTGRRERERDAQERHQRAATARPTPITGPTSSRETDFFVKKADGRSRSSSYKRPGFTLGGPVVIPGLYDGHDRTFFFAAVEWLYDTFPEPLAQTVPTQAMRNGDFSALLAQGITIYDPGDRRRLDRRARRAPAVRRQHHSRRTASTRSRRRCCSYYPLPNQAGDASGRNNFFYEQPAHRHFYSVSMRVDHTLTVEAALFVRYTRNDRRESRNADLRRGQRHRPDRQLPVPQERRRHRGPRLDA